MTRLRFLLARLLRQEGVLQRLSVAQSDLLADLAGCRVALIGNARALAEGHLGAEIDAHDRVIRINRAPMPAAHSHGQRCDWLGLATRLPDAERNRIQPGRILWMSHKRKRLDWASARSPGFYLHPLADWQALGRELGAPPSTGAMLIALALRADLTSLRLYGFDFMASKSLSGRRDAAQVPHDFAAEANWVQNRAARDSRLIL